MRPGFDLDAYFARIGYVGARRPELNTLAAIHLAHAQTIPFENLNPLMKWPVHLDAQSLQQKLVGSGRGGYCFEQNLLLNHSLKELGFEVTPLAARVLWNYPESTVTPRSHMLLLVTLGGRSYIVDAGFGGMTLTGPLLLIPDTPQATPHGVFRLVRAGQGFVLQAETGDAWKALYRFDLQEQFQQDFEVSSWYLSNHPESQFVTTLIAARPDHDCRYALRNNEFATHQLDGSTERRLLASADELRTVLESTFCLTLPDAPELSAALESVISRAGSH